MRKYIAKFIVLGYGIFLCLNVSGQSIEKLRDERESLLNEISETSRLIEEKKENRSDNLRELNLIDREIQSRVKLINNFKKEIDQLDNQIEVNQMLVNDLESDIYRIKKEYASLVRDSYKRKGELNQLMFLFSSGDFSKAYLKYRLFKEYSRYRQRQGEILIESQSKVQALVKEIQQQKSEKESVLGDIENEISRLQNNKNRKNRLVQRLKTEQQWLQKSLKEKQAAAAELENRIKELIASEKDVNINAAESSEFSDQRGKLTWPVEKGVIINPFGEHRHAVLKNVTIKNNGIDIQVSGKSNVFCVHPGKVSTVAAIPGLNKAVIVRHGKYLTVYGNLVDVFVTKGDIVASGQVIGKVYHDESEMQEILHFEIWEENTKLDPEQWLLR
ncbi:murein hydrolase activator EnvC family protein [Marinilabilia rubra]|uniref:Sugar tyrosine-protein kinase n=1 Tax=Marinilabilia rubra TaxID=2162893 RepID=A0A2U2B9L2_9BACT|nr:peptidoglycan DD-metalloendopeptidase family protein [Marinilabilia rubra]PWD99733.1 sugar tyrosine-protein kinase [Marinilabilia rubra]